jgi:hypothetical protein
MVHEVGEADGQVFLPWATSTARRSDTRSKNAR